MENAKKILLIDSDDPRRKTRVRLLTGAGYTVDLRDDYISAERLDREGFFDLVILALHGQPEKAIAYSNHLSRGKPLLPILLLTDFGVYVPPGTLSRNVASGDPAVLIGEIASILAGSNHVRELPIPVK
jgi:ActR/RegA family two-component response regulator